MLRKWQTGDTYVASYSAKEIGEAKAKTARGFDGYVAQLRQREIERFEELRVKGQFKPKALAWAGRLDLAQKEAASRSKWLAKVWIVPAEVA